MKLLIFFLALFIFTASIHAAAITPAWSEEAATKLKKNPALKQRLVTKFNELFKKPAPTGDQQLLLAIQTNAALKQMVDSAKV